MAIFVLDGRFDLIPEAIGGINDRKQLSSGLSDGFQVSQQRAAQLATQNVRV
jgi:hypothetical protein